LYQKLTGGESVHLLDWPEPRTVDKQLVERMQFVRDVIQEGLSQRSQASIKVRQPLSKVSVNNIEATLGDDIDEFTSIILEELNVKSLQSTRGKAEQKLQLDTTITPKLKKEGLAREVVRHVQNARKQADLQVDNRIELCLQTDDDELRQAIAENSDYICNETLCAKQTDELSGGYEEAVRVDGSELTIMLKKHA
ncbi:MAG: DUF5915 domain-containing protein, partial [Actinobacteria bacterium]|nr:DUF5915 domain-containing protein [Actinomycetota bacterium]